MSEQKPVRRYFAVTFTWPDGYQDTFHHSGWHYRYPARAALGVSLQRLTETYGMAKLPNPIVWDVQELSEDDYHASLRRV